MTEIQKNSYNNLSSEKQEQFMEIYNDAELFEHLKLFAC